MRLADKAGGLFGVTIRRPVAILMVTVAAVVFGAFSYRLLPVDLMPDISYPSLTVRTEYTGAAPEEVEEFEKKFGRLDLTPLDEVFREGMKPMVKLVEEVDRIARFMRKLREAFEELER